MYGSHGNLQTLIYLRSVHEQLATMERHDCLSCGLDVSSILLVSISVSILTVYAIMMIANIIHDVHVILQFDWFARIPGKWHNAINNVLPAPFTWVGSGAQELGALNSGVCVRECVLAPHRHDVPA